MKGILLSGIYEGSIGLYSGDKYLGAFPLRRDAKSLTNFNSLLETQAETLIDVSRCSWECMKIMLQFDPYEEDIRSAISRLKNVCEYLL